ncbi:MAG: FAD-dependent oxidoreductase [Caldilineaceae bacterium]
MNEITCDILIIGAGLSGLMAAQTLAGSNKQVILIDKGNSVGGRLATRRIGTGRADHGAQFFTVRTAQFQHWVAQWQTSGLVYSWSYGWSDGSLAQTPNDGHPRFAVRGGMNNLAKELAALLPATVKIHTGIRASQVAQDGQSWRVTTEGQGSYLCSALVITTPVPQTLALLDAGKVDLLKRDRMVLDAIRYDPCLCALFWVNGEVYLPEPGALQRPGATISWIADNKRKGISPGATLITMHANGEFSRAHYDQPDDEVSLTFLEELLPFLTPNSEIFETQIKRWRYSIPTVTHPDPYLQASDLPPLFFGGDAFGGPRVEGAALSGMAIGNTLLSSHS